MERLIFANIGWMIHYQGQSSNDTISGGGSWRDDDKHEVYNFQNLKGWCYGYVQTVRLSDINLLRIDHNIQETTEKLDNVYVIWTARRPDVGGTYIVGWYKHATVFRTLQNIQNKKNYKRNYFDYNIIAKAEDCTLLNVDDRLFEIPRASQGNEGWMGQSNVWYADADIPKIKSFRNKVIDYVLSLTHKKTLTNKHFKVNVKTKKKVEEAAIKIVQGAYKNKGYEVYSVEKENKGWDLEAIKGKLKLRIEVKGLSGEEISIHITQNEYNKMREKNNADYRLCVVTNVLNFPELFTFIFDNGRWICEEDVTMELSFEEHIAAIAYVQ